jgi:hypothetical protein
MNRAPIIKTSPVHGVGVFLRRTYAPGERILKCIDYINLLVSGWPPRITRLCLKVNHSKFRRNGDVRRGQRGWYIHATRPLHAGEELFVDYDACPWFIQPPHPTWRDT